MVDEFTARTGPSVLVSQIQAKEAATQAESERRIVETERKRMRMEEAQEEGRLADDSTHRGNGSGPSASTFRKSGW
jgi:hypothetical protein